MKNTKQYANISLVTVRDSGDGRERSEIFKEGSFYKKNGIYYVTYAENDETGLGKTRLFLKIMENGVDMRRMGEVNTQIQYRQGQITDSFYETPFGRMDIRIRTDKISNKLLENGGILKIFYTLMAGGEDIKNEITLDIKLRSEDDES